MKRLISILLTVAMLLTAFPLSTVFAADEIDKWDGIAVASSFDGGSGSEDDPYLISTCAQLVLLRNIVNASDADYEMNYAATYGAAQSGTTVSGSTLTHKRLSGKHFMLTTDLDFDGKNFGKGIGNSTGIAQTFTFAGSFDGGGHIIRNYYTSYAWDLRAMGLFGITEDASIANLGMENAKIEVANGSAVFGYAVLVGKAYGSLKLSNCYVRNSEVEFTLGMSADAEMGLGILTGSIGYDRDNAVGHEINNCYAVNNIMTYSGEENPRLFKKVAVFGKTAPYGIVVSNCYASGLNFTNMTASSYSNRTNNLFTPSISGTTACSSDGKNCFVEGNPSASEVDYLKEGETFSAVTADELKSLPPALNSDGAYETAYSDILNGGYPILKWEYERMGAPYTVSALHYTDADGIYVSSPRAGGMLKEAYIAKNVTDSESKTVVFAYFSANGSMKAIKSAALDASDFDDDGTAHIGVDMQLPDSTADIEGGKTKIFIWNNLLTLKTDIKAISIDYAPSVAPTLYMIGDSTMANYDDTMYPRAGTGQMLGKYLPEINIANMAVAGADTNSFLGGKIAESANWNKIKSNISAGDYVILQLGINDNGHRIGIAKYKSNLELMIDTLHKKGANVIVCTPNMSRSFDSSGKLRAEFDDDGKFVGTTVLSNSENEEQGDYLAALKTLIAEKQSEHMTGFLTVDMTAVTAEMIGADAAFDDDSRRLYMQDVYYNPNIYASDSRFENSVYNPQSGGSAYDDAKYDNVHLTYYGADVTAQKMAVAISALDVPLSDYCRNLNTEIIYPNLGSR